MEVVSKKDYTILLVDDVPSNLQLLSSHLCEYTTAIAKNGIKAIQRAEKLNPHLILMDIQMPEMDGYEACRRLKENPRTRNIPIIFMTALSDSRSTVEGFEMGAVDYITKPFDKAELLARVKTHLSVHQMKNELQEKNRLLEENAVHQKRVDKIMRHDLKGPLQVLINIPMLLTSEGPVTPGQKQMIQIMDEAAQNMLEMINSSLTIYKIEQGIYRPVFETIDIAEVISQANSTQSHKFSGTSFVFNSEKKCTVQGEYLLLLTLFSNLLKNAYEAAHSAGTVEVTVAENDRAVTIAITNPGSVPEEIREIFFNEFTTAGKEHGTGLGTYSAKLLTEALNGSIELDCSRENFTTVRISFPL